MIPMAMHGASCNLIQTMRDKVTKHTVIPYNSKRNNNTNFTTDYLVLLHHSLMFL